MKLVIRWLWFFCCFKAHFFETLQTKRFDVLMLNECQARNFWRELGSSFRWSILVIDEAHRIKNDKSNLFQKLKKIPSEFKLLLTATPIVGSIRDLWNLISFIDAEYFNEEFKGMIFPSHSSDAVLGLQKVCCRSHSKVSFFLFIVTRKSHEVS